MKCIPWVSALTVTVIMLVGVSQVHAQVIGTFRWQFAPFCNVVTLTVEQKGPSFVLSGFDDLCDAPQRAPASGTAQPNPDGTIGLGITVLRPDGLAVHHTAAITLVTLGGTWFDNYGNSGTLAFNASGPSAAGSRPVTLRGNYAVNFPATAANDSGVSMFSFGVTLRAEPEVHFVGHGLPPAPQCPGTSTDPQAAPGHLCVYESNLVNAVLRCVIRTDNGFYCDAKAAKTGAGVYSQAFGEGQSYTIGTWALTVP